MYYYECIIVCMTTRHMSTHIHKFYCNACVLFVYSTIFRMIGIFVRLLNTFRTKKSLSMFPTKKTNTIDK